MVTQLLGHVTKRIDAVTNVTRTAAAVAHPDANEQDRAAAHRALEASIVAAREATAKNPVKQGSMQTGEIELF
jgi:hypothetical protein